jgi:acyl-CoA thioesterase I
MPFRLCSVVFLNFLFSLIVSSLVAMPASAMQTGAMQTSAMQTSQPVIVVYGDSLSAGYGIKQDEGWVALLQQRLSKQNINQNKLNYQVVNASISGETTSGGLSRFSEMLKLQKPTVVIIALGANDGLRGLNIAEINSNLDKMIVQAQATNAHVLLLGMKIPPNYGLKYSQQFSDNYQLLAKKHAVELVPFFLEGVAGNPQLIQADGLHPLAIAQPKILDNVWPVLSKILK